MLVLHPDWINNCYYDIIKIEFITEDCMMIDNLLELMEIDSTSGKEKELAYYIYDHFKTNENQIELFDNNDNTFNVLIKWGEPSMLFCTHLDTVPPYIAPKLDGDIIRGRGACDAKGQIAAMYQACKNLAIAGETDYGLLLLAGEEVGSKGAKKANMLKNNCKFMVIGEPTENKLIRAGKGTKLFEVEILGKNAHSGYPQLGDNAIERMREFLNILADYDFPEDPILGNTSYNIGLLHSDNAVNVISSSVKFKIYFRTTFVSDEIVVNLMKDLSDDKIIINKLGGDQPINFETFDDENFNIVSYGSDAPALSNFGTKVLYGAGSIFNAHTNHEFVTIGELNEAVKALESIYYKIKLKING